ncbi:MAG: hypothetical protein P1V20_24710 [Verrucomicrobiales bacterium]|nr:hypothetical protein [Verrucomicrobiales bacterium]
MLKRFFNLLGSKPNKQPNGARPGKSSEWTPREQSVSPEELCGIDPHTMSQEMIRKTLAKLYKRHNAAVSSLNPELREEAVVMLDAIVDCRERYIDNP